jgi:antirestriction protein ArdC
VAELSAALLCNTLFPEYAGLEVENHAAYLQSWMQNLKEEPNIFFEALAQAQKAQNLLLTLGGHKLPDYSVAA